MSIPPPRVGLSSIRIPSSAGGGVTVRVGVAVPNENAGFDAFAGAGAGVPNEKPPVLATALVSDCGAGEPNESPVGALAGVVVEGPKVNPVDVPVGFSAVEGVVEEAPNANILLAGVEGAAVAVCLADCSNEKGVDDPGGLDDSVESADADVEVNEGLCASEKPGFKGSTLSAGANVAIFGNENEAVAVPADWAVAFVLGPAADTDVPNPGNDAVAPPNRGLGRAAPASSFFGCCGADEGVRLNGSELPVDGCLDDDVNVGWIDVLWPKLNRVGGGGFSVSELGDCAEVEAAASGAQEGGVDANGSGIVPVSDLLTGAGSAT